MQEIIVVGAGGFIGAVARYLLSGLIHRNLDSSFPWGTFTVNIVGCFLIGCLLYLVENRLVVSDHNETIPRNRHPGCFYHFRDI